MKSLDDQDDLAYRLTADMVMNEDEFIRTSVGRTWTLAGHIPWNFRHTFVASVSVYVPTVGLFIEKDESFTLTRSGIRRQEFDLFLHADTLKKPKDVDYTLKLATWE